MVTIALPPFANLKEPPLVALCSPRLLTFLTGESEKAGGPEGGKSHGGEVCRPPPAAPEDSRPEALHWLGGGSRPKKGNTKSKGIIKILNQY